MTYEEKIEAAAKEFADQNCAPFEKLSYFDCAHGFARGVKWCQENPPPEFVLRSDIEKMFIKLKWARAQDVLSNCRNIIEIAIEEFEQKYPKGDEK